METSEERREVARKLRELTVCDGVDAFDIAKALRLEAVSRTEYDTESVRRLADLIEPPEITEDTSDGYHTFGQLYYQRMKLFSVLVEEHIDRAWKTRRHEDGELCFGGGWFLVAIDTPVGTYGYHFAEEYWYEFGCDELPKAKPWDGYDERDVGRLMSLVGEPRLGQQERTCRISDTDHEYEDSVRCDACHMTFSRPWEPFRYCPHCGAKVMVHG